MCMCMCMCMCVFVFVCVNMCGCLFSEGHTTYVFSICIHLIFIYVIVIIVFFIDKSKINYYEYYKIYTWDNIIISAKHYVITIWYITTKV